MQNNSLSSLRFSFDNLLLVFISIISESIRDGRGFFNMC